MNTINNDFINARRKEIGKRIAFERKKKGKSQADFAEDLSKYFYGAKFSQTTISAWENSDNSIPIEKIFAMADYFGCDCGYLLCDYDERVHDLKDVCEYTGLSEDSISHLYSNKQWGLGQEAYVIDLLLNDARKRNINHHFSPIIELLFKFFTFPNDEKLYKVVISPSLPSPIRYRVNGRAIENAVLMEIQQALISLKQGFKNRKEGK